MLYVTGGKQRTRKLEEWNLFEKALIVLVDPDTQKLTVCEEYVSPPEVCTDTNPSLSFKAATIEQNRMYICTSTEVLIYELPDFRRVAYLSLPCFNDLHHVRPDRNGNLLIVNTGLDMLLEVTPEGKIVREWSTVCSDPWLKFSRSTDYRKVATTKPHASHPNYVFRLGEDIWVTRFHQKDVLCVTDPGRRIELGHTAHDGCRAGDYLYFTSVDGFVFVVNAGTLRVEEEIDLNALDHRPPPLGWCRGVLPVDEGMCWVGFSKIRPTTFKENLVWLGHRLLQQHLSTRIVLYDLCKKAKRKEINLEPSGLNCVFSILPAVDRGA